MRKHSPLTYAAKVQDADADPALARRPPLSAADGQGVLPGAAAREVPTQMVIYPGEGHGIRQPRHREDVLRRVLAWFERYDGK